MQFQRRCPQPPPARRRSPPGAFPNKNRTNATRRIMEYLRLCGQILGGLRVVLDLDTDGALQLHPAQCRALQSVFSDALSTASALIRDTLPNEDAWNYLEPAVKELYCVLRDGETFVRQCRHAGGPTNDWWIRAILLADSVEATGTHLHNAMWAITLLHDCLELAAENAAGDTGAARRLLHAKKYDEDFLLPKLFKWQYGKQYLLSELTCNFPASSDSVNAAETELLLAEIKLRMAQLDKNEARLAEFLFRRLRHSHPSHEGCAAACTAISPKEIHVNRRIGTGSFGEVKEITWGGETFAMRHMFTNVDTFRQEFDVLMKLRHPNLLQTLGCVIDAQRNECSVVTELMCRDLRSFISENCSARKRHPPFPFTLPKAVEIMLQIARGLAFLHQNGILHGALKASNVLVRTGPVDGQFTVKVSDYGLVRSNLMSSRFSSVRPELPAWWRAPEVASVRPEDEAAEGVFPTRYSEKADMYSFGMLCYEILTGKVPYDDARHKSDIAKVKCGEKPLIPAECPRYLSAVIKRCWQSDPKCRPTAAAACRALRHIKRKVILDAVTEGGTVPAPDVLEIDSVLAKRLPDWVAPEVPGSACGIPFQMFAFKVMEMEKICKFNLAAAGVAAASPVASVSTGTAKVNAKALNDENVESLDAVIQSLKLKLPNSSHVVGGYSASPLSNLPTNKKVLPSAPLRPAGRPAVSAKVSPVMQKKGANIERRRKGVPSTNPHYWST